MKIKYQFANETVEIEVSEEWANVLIDLDRQEYNANHKETRRHCSLNALDPNGKRIPADSSIEEEVLAGIERERLYAALLKLKPRHQELIRLAFFDGKSYCQIARDRGCGEATIRQSVNLAIKKLKNFL